jgi:DNA-binding SARP family transcriptional activator
MQITFHGEGEPMFLAKSAIPFSDLVFIKSDSIERSASFPFTYITGPPGYFSSGYLSRVLADKGRPKLWLCLGAEDGDPATLLLSLVHAGKRFDQHLGDGTLNQMQRYPGCIHGWAPLFERLAAEFADGLPRTCALVLENAHQLGETWFVLKLVVFHFLNRFAPSVTRVLTSHTGFSAPVIIRSANLISIRDLRIQGEDQLTSRANTERQLTKADLNRVIQLSQGRSEVMSGVLIACEQTENEQVRKILYQVKTQDQLLIQLGRNCLQTAEPEELQALAFALRLGYFHTELFKEIIGCVSLPAGPWLQPLSDGWYRLREVWRPALKNILPRYLGTQADVLCQAADLLAEMGAIEIAVPVYLQLREYRRVARAIRSNMERLMNYGQWQTLNGWLKQLPQEVVSESPHLLYIQGELQAFYGLLEKARNSFVVAGNLFSVREDHRNTCRSLLADSALAYRDGDEQRALLRAQNAHALSSDGSMSQEQAWANWQLGMLASLAGRPGFARIRFKNACQLTNDPYTRGLFQQALTYIQEIENAGLQLEYYRHEEQLAEKNRLEMFNRLLKLFETPPDTLSDILELYGWLAVPLILKLPAQISEVPAARRDPLQKLVDQIKRKSRMFAARQGESRTRSTLSPLDLLAPIRSGASENEARAASVSDSTPIKVSDFLPVEGVQKPNPVIMIYCLGPLRVLNNKQFVTSWPSHKAQLVFKYLLLHRNTLVHKETIMEAFWPEADVESARRNLHQAIYNLRLTLRGIDDDLQIIEFTQDGYRLNPAVPIWIDYPVFEQHCTTARQKDLTGLTEQAMVEYALAEQMYMDHLFSEDRYEDWMRSQREYLWQIYLSAAMRLAEYQFQKKDYSSAISIGQRILQKDPCEEGAHQILMRCFHNQGQRQLAIRQYEICRQALRDELDVEPSAITRQFFSEILHD